MKRKGLINFETDTYYQNRNEICAIGIIASIFILIIALPAYAFDPLVAEKKTLDLAKYFVIVATIFGATRALFKSQVWVAILLFIAGGVIYNLVDPVALKNLGSSILSYLTIIGNGGGSVQPTPPPKP